MAKLNSSKEAVVKRLTAVGNDLARGDGTSSSSREAVVNKDAVVANSLPSATISRVAMVMSLSLKHAVVHVSTQFTRFTSTEVQILTLSRVATVISLSLRARFSVSICALVLGKQCQCLYICTGKASKF